MISKRAGEPCIIQTFRQGGPTTPVLRRAGPQFVENVPLTRGPLAGMHAPARFACAVAAVSLLSARTLDAQTLDRRQLERIEQTLRQEGQEIVALADAAAGGEPAPGDFSLSWHNDYLKAQTGTFIPFMVLIQAKSGQADAALLYVRASRSRPGSDDSRDRGRRTTPTVAGYPFEEIYPVTLVPGQPVRIARGCSLAPGRYDLTVVVRERERPDARGSRRAAAVLRQTLDVPDFSSNDLTTSTVMLADALTVLPGPPGGNELSERPYVIGDREVQPAADSRFRPSEELIVVFLVYNPAVTPAKHFDLEVEYHFFRKNRAGEGGPGPGVPAGVAALAGERYFNRTEPQRFNPVILGPTFDPAAGQPVLAGQGVPLAGFPEGEYRLSIRVTDLVAGRSLERQVTFTVLQ
jgi:hypothetical protein